MHIIDTNLIFSHAPVSLLQFEEIKNNSNDKRLFNKASLYIIAKSVKTKFRLCDYSEFDGLDIARCLFDRESSPFAHSPFERQLLNIPVSESVHEITLLRKNGKAVLLEIFQNSCYAPIKAIYMPPSEVDYSLYSSMSFEEILYRSSMGIGSLIPIGDIRPFITYEIMYVGQCVGELLTVRFKSHHALQRMLIQEKVISKDERIGEELILFPFYSYHDALSVINKNTTADSFVRGITDNIGCNKFNIHKDAEKALVKCLNPKYNVRKFVNYPKSDDGLFRSESNLFSYVIAENVIFKYDEGTLFGDKELIHFSRVVGDKDKNTAVIYSPGELYSESLKERLFPIT